MKRSIQKTLLAALLCCPLLATGQSGGLKNKAAYLPIDEHFDFGDGIEPEVNVHLPSFLIKDAISGFNNDADDPFAAAGVNLSEIVGDIELIRVVVIPKNEGNQAAVQSGVDKLFRALRADWMPIVSVPKENVGIYAMSDASGERMAGLAVLVDERKTTVVANIVGGIPIGKILKLAMRHSESGGKEIQKIIEQVVKAADAAAAPPAKKDN